jgi:hypothetical protein
MPTIMYDERDLVPPRSEDEGGEEIVPGRFGSLRVGVIGKISSALQKRERREKNNSIHDINKSKGQTKEYISTLNSHIPPTDPAAYPIRRP